ncbi:MAG: ABC transporter substrate-binding protein [Nitrospirota bacterium]
MEEYRRQNTEDRIQKLEDRRGRKWLLMHLIFVIVPIVFIFSASILKAEIITYKDKLGRKVVILVPVKRAVFFITYELIPSLDIWDRVAGIGRWAYENDLMKATKPNIASTIPSTGSGSDVNIEALLKLKPDLVITWTFKPETVRFMEEKGLRVIAIYPESLSELYDVMRLHGRLFGKEKKMEHSIEEMEKIFKLIRERVSNIPVDKKRKVLWLGGKPTTVACRIGVTNDIFKMIGGINPASSIPQRNADVPMERIIAWNPDVIFIWGNAGYKAKDILNSPQWRFVKAVKEGRIYKAPEWSTWSQRLAPIALWMATKTYPEYFRDIDIKKVTDDFYHKVFGISYSKVKQFE